MYKNINIKIIDFYSSKKDQESFLTPKINIQKNQKKIFYYRIAIKICKNFIKFLNIITYPIFFSFKTFYYFTCFIMLLALSLFNLFLCCIALLYTVLLDYLRQLLELNIYF